MSGPRPKKLNYEQTFAVAMEIARALSDAGHLDPAEVEGAAGDIVKYGQHWNDGYELARALDKSAHWDCNLEMAEELDNFSRLYSRAMDAAEKQWAVTSDIRPPLPVETRVRLASGECGKITGIYDHGAAKFLVAIDGDPKADTPQQSRRIVNFEDVTELAP